MSTVFAPAAVVETKASKTSLTPALTLYSAWPLTNAFSCNAVSLESVEWHLWFFRYLPSPPSNMWGFCQVYGSFRFAISIRSAILTSRGFDTLQFYNLRVWGKGRGHAPVLARHKWNRLTGEATNMSGAFHGRTWEPPEASQLRHRNRGGEGKQLPGLTGVASPG